MEEHFKNYSDIAVSRTLADHTLIRNSVRFSVLTPYLLRIEHQKDRIFCDDATQSVLCRNFDRPVFTVTEENAEICIKTEKAKFIYSFTKKKLIRVVLSNGIEITEFGKENLKGTCRTLDGTNGKTAIGSGIISKTGVALFDDSDTLIISSDGSIRPRKAKEKDIYYFAYGHDYRLALKDYFQLTGFPPLIPRFVFGNWWSRYKAYTQKEYTDLMDRFEKENIPISVATVDMDWHWVDVISRFGKEARDRSFPKGPFELFYNLSSPGWTGYSWNTDLFPDPKGFLKNLKNRNLKVTMNLHPASGCKFFEDSYEEFARYMGIDPESKQQIFFDITDPKFISGYFRYLHHPHEKDGVDFWWIDWQQGTKTAVEGLDPLWALNHYHSLDNGRDGKRPLILSRFAGAGSHRYPLGFSGDTAQSWSTLDFQPYFTSTAANIGYTWWSHDIGGHHFGKRDDELYLRWVQFGIFSPVMRLHSTSNEFMGKEPWKYRGDIYRLASEAMRFRHRLIPYIYSMNKKTHTEGIPLTEPMYYGDPEDERAYLVPNQYRFGSELIVCPITKPADKKTFLAGTKVFLPKGRYTDIFTARVYNGDFIGELFRDETSIPVLAKEGAIIPLGPEKNDPRSVLPDSFELLIYRGNSSFTLYEDDGETLDYRNGKYTETVFEITEENDTVTFRINGAAGDPSILPMVRAFTLSFCDIMKAGNITLKINGREESVNVLTSKGYIEMTVLLAAQDDAEVILQNISVLHSPDIKELKTEMISGLQGNNNAKKKLTECLNENGKGNVPSCLKAPFAELDHLF